LALVGLGIASYSPTSLGALEMKIIKVALSRAQVTAELRSSLCNVGNTALRVLDQAGFYNNMEDGDRTVFTIGLGPTGFTTAREVIVGNGPSDSVIQYSLFGPFWEGLDRFAINAHIRDVFKTFKRE
jgi:hypothetical protein